MAAVNSHEKRVLIVDDDEHILRMFTRVARMRGFSVLQAHDGIEALEIAREQAPDIIVLDISLPRLDGRDVLLRLTRDPRTVAIPIVVASGRTDHLQRLQAL